MDATVTFRPGARFGPAAIREASVGLEEYSPVLDAQLMPGEVCDLGDVVLPFADVAGALERIRAVARGVCADRKFLVGLGGEHLATLPLVQAAAAALPGLEVIHLDAHADLRAEYLGDRLSHATVMRRVAEEVGAERLWQFGIRSGTREEFAFARHLSPDLTALPAVLERLGDRPLYLTVDIDVVDPAFAPGTGTPEPGGPSAADVLEAVRAVARRRLVAMDVMEVAPALDPSGRTAALAAKLVREAILARRATGEVPKRVG
ncbi:MAG: agmatinase [Firmicutes bacterium]|nr:agmatinase [Bacillota bacterium]